jgi:transcriptional regulator with XRE-family HTH domain
LHSIYKTTLLYHNNENYVNENMNERERIEQVKETLGLTARQFAAEIHVQPGTISNMMAGRNNPSLEVMKRIMERYPSLNPEWLVLGKGEMWRTPPGREAGLFDGLPPEGVVKAPVRTTVKKEEPQAPAAPPKKVTKIVVYYSDNTFEEFSNN